MQVPPIPVETGRRAPDEPVDLVSASRSAGQGFYSRIGKRWLDLGASFVGLVLLAPLFALCATVIKFSSPGPVFFRQYRAGKDGRLFRAVKFRSMLEEAERIGPDITIGGDARVTVVGALLRRLKIDELPQLWNVLKGEMSLVGPRPELPDYVANYSPQQRQVLMVRPGVTDIASILYRHEAQLLRESSDPERLYRETILPHKLALNLEYMHKMSYSYDLYLIFRTLVALFVSESAKKENLK